MSQRLPSLHTLWVSFTFEATSSTQLENGFLDLGRPSGGKGDFRPNRAKARLLKDS